MTIGDDFKILSDKTTDGVRHITAVPSAIVCSAQIDFDLIEGKIHNLRYIKGCDGNLQAIGRLLDGMEAGKAVEILSGVNCHGRGTSCSDQLTRVLRKVIGYPGECPSFPAGAGTRKQGRENRDVEKRSKQRRQINYRDYAFQA